MSESINFPINIHLVKKNQLSSLLMSVLYLVHYSKSSYNLELLDKPHMSYVPVCGK